MILPFIGVYIIILIVLIAKSRYKILANDIFWLLASWALIIGFYMFSGIDWDYSLSISTAIYIVLCFTLFILLRSYGVKKSINADLPNSTNIYKIENNTKFYIILGSIGSAMYIFDYIRNNGILTQKSDYSLSILGTIGNLFVPCILVVGLYLFADSYVYKGKISIKGTLCIIVYPIPCILNGGRESILYTIIALISILSYKKWNNYNNKNEFKKKKIHIVAKLIIIAVVIIAGYFLILVTNNRFTDEVSNFYLNTLNVPDTIKNEADLFGQARNIYANTLYYFVHELPGFEMVFRYYDGPYMFGLYELNIISRRLPAFLGLDYQLVLKQLGNIISLSGDRLVLNYGWRTMLASLIFDFGRVGTPIVCAILGYFTGKARGRILKSQDTVNIVLSALLCMCMFTTIQLGPFFNFNVYGTLIWWALIFKTKRVIKLSN